MASKTRLQHAKELFLLAYPVSLGQVSNVLTNIADTVMLGKYNSLHLAAGTFAFNVFIPLLVFSIGFSMGITPFITQAHTEENQEELKTVSSNGFILFSGLSALLFLLGSVVGLFLNQMNQPDEIVHLAKPYYFLLICSLVPVVITMIFKQVTEGMSFTKPYMIISIVSNAVNIVLNYLLIYGKFGIEPMGIVGAGIATLIARCSLVVLSIIFILKNPLYRVALWNNPFIRGSVTKIAELVKISFPISLQFTMEVSAFAISAVMIGWLGTTALASHQISISIAATTYLIASGIGVAATVKTSYYTTKNEKENLLSMIKTAFIMVLCFMGSTAILIFILRHQLPLFYVKSHEIAIIDLSSTLLMLAAIFQLSDGVQVVGHGVLRGLKDVKIPTIYSIVAYWVFGLPAGYLLATKMNFGVVGYWLGFSIGLATLAGLLFRRVKILTK